MYGFDYNLEFEVSEDSLESFDIYDNDSSVIEKSSLGIKASTLKEMYDEDDDLLLDKN